MGPLRDWQEMKAMSSRLLVERTGEDIAAWNQRIQKEQLPDEKSLLGWLRQAYEQND